MRRRWITCMRGITTRGWAGSYRSIWAGAGFRSSRSRGAWTLTFGTLRSAIPFLPARQQRATRKRARLRRTLIIQRIQQALSLPFTAINDRSNGMVDAPSENGGYGDTKSLALQNPMPMATVYRGKVGWHEIQNGQLSFTVPVGARSTTQQQQIQKNLNSQQILPVFWIP